MFKKPKPGSQEAIIRAHKREFFEAKLLDDIINFDEKAKKPLTYIGAGVLFFAGIFFTETFNNNLAYAKAPPISQAGRILKDLNTVHELRINGACSDNLLAEKQLYSYLDKTSGFEVLPDYYLSQEETYSSAASLAYKNNIKCYPEVKNPTNLTPDFNLQAMETNHDCSQKLNNEIKNTTSLTGNSLKNVALQNEKIKIMANLAIDYQISC